MARKKIERNISFDDEKNLYYVTLNYGKDESGKRVKPTKTFAKIQDARKALIEFEANKAKKNIVFPSSTKFKDYAIYWLDDIKSLKCEMTTMYGYRNIVNNHLIPYFGDYKLQDLKQKPINKYFKKKDEDGLSKNTIRKHYDLLKDILKNAVNEEIILKNPLDKIEPLKIDKKEMNFYTIEQLNKLFEVIKDDRMEIVVKLAGLLGLRREEIAGLKWKNIDLENNLITIAEARVQAGKKIKDKGTKNTSSYRTLHMPDDIKDILLKIQRKQKDQKNILKNSYNNKGYVMAWENGEPYRPNYLSDLFKKTVTDNNLPPIRLHDLRHTFASVANELGVGLYDISKALGHSQIGTTSEIYTHMFDKTHKKTISKVADAFKETEKNKE